MQDTDTETTRELRGQRVTITFLGDGETLTGVLDGVTSEMIFFRGVPGGITRTDIADISPDPLYCAECGASTLQLHDGVCASCYREQARTAPKPVEPCENCGRTPAIRSPAASGKKPFLCVECHASSGNGLKVHPKAPVIASCATEDVSSDKHEWTRVRGNRLRCVRCQNAEKYV